MDRYLIPGLAIAALIAAHFYLPAAFRSLARVAIVCVLLIAAHAIVQGKWTERWEQRPVEKVQLEFAERIKNVPTSVGSWESIEVPVDERQHTASRAVGRPFSRAFQNKLARNQVVNIYLVAGHPRDITQHTPDQCYVLSGYEEAEDQQRRVIDYDNTVAEFSTNRFRKNSTVQGINNQRIFWSFTSDGHWLAPTSAKLELMHHPALYKIYAITEAGNDSRSRADEAATVAFLREFMPAVNAALFPKGQGVATTEGATTESAGAGTQAIDASNGAAKDVVPAPATTN